MNIQSLFNIFEGNPDTFSISVSPLQNVDSKLRMLNSHLMGSQRRIAKLIMGYIPVEVEKVMHPFACGQDLTFELIRKGYYVIANDRMYYSCCIANTIKTMPSNFIFEEIKGADGYFTNTNDKFPESVRMTIDGIAQINDPKLDAILGRTLINLSWRGQMKSWCRTDQNRQYIDRNIFIKQLYENQKYLNKYAISAEDLEIFNTDAYDIMRMYPGKIDMIYFGTPTVMDMKNTTFYKRFEIIDSVLKQRQVIYPNDWTVDNYNSKLNNLLQIIKLRKIPYVICGWGSGVETRKQRYDLLKKYFNHIEESELSFKGFDDVVYFCKDWK